LNSNPGQFVCLTFIFVSVGESRLLVSWHIGGRCSMIHSDEDRDRSRRTGAEDRDGRIGWVLGGRGIERSDDVVFDLHRAHGDEERGFLG
jgi:hypothetical protein